MNGLVLAGGHSTRMGMDKGLISYHGQPQREYLFDLLASYCREVFVSCREDQEVEEHLNPIHDASDVPGPLNGLLSAFALQNTCWLMVAVDMPFVDAPVVEALIAGRDPRRLATCYFNRETNAPEPLLAIWESHAYSALATFVQQGKSSPRKFLTSHPVKTIEPPHPRILTNINTPAAVKAVVT